MSHPADTSDGTTQLIKVLMGDEADMLCDNSILSSCLFISMFCLQLEQFLLATFKLKTLS